MNVANKKGHTKSERHDRYKHVILAALVSITLLSSALAMISETGVQKAYADKGGKGGSGGGNSSSDHGNNESDRGKSSTTTTSNSTDKGQGSKDNHSDGDNSNKGQSQHKQEKSDNAESKGNNSDLAKAQKFKPHQLNETMSWPYGANTTYSIEASGTAMAIGSSTTNVTSATAELSAEMSIWKTTKSLVSMDVRDGSSITVDGKTMEFYSGQAHYLPNMHKMLLVGFIVENQGNVSDAGNGENSGDQNATDTGATNQTSTTTTNQTLTTTDITNQTSTEGISTNETSTDTATNQTSTEVPSAGQEIDEEGEAEPALKHIKLWIKVTGQKDESVPSSETPSSMTIKVLSPQSNISSEWFLQMDGELYTSP